MAVAVRTVEALGVIVTIRGRPVEGLMWVRVGVGGEDGSFEDEEGREREVETEACCCCSGERDDSEE